MVDQTETAKEREYRELLEFLFEQHVRPRLPEIREHAAEFGRDEWVREMSAAIRAARLSRFIQSYCRSDADVYRTLDLQHLMRAIEGVRDAERAAWRMAELSGFEQLLDDPYVTDIASGLSSDHLPPVDEAVMREIGSQNPRLELHMLVSQGKKLLERGWRLEEGEGSRSRRVFVDHEGKRTPWLAEIDHRLSDAQKEIDRFDTQRAEASDTQREPPRSRRWFKGLGQIAQGAALTIVNIGVASSLFHFPISPEAQTLGAITSVIAGFGSMTAGIGDLRSE